MVPDAVTYFGIAVAVSAGVVTLLDAGLRVRKGARRRGGDDGGRAACGGGAASGDGGEERWRRMLMVRSRSG